MIGKRITCMAAALAILSTLTGTSAVAGEGCNWANCKNNNMKAGDRNPPINVDVNLPRNFAASFATDGVAGSADGSSVANSGYLSTGAVAVGRGSYALGAGFTDGAVSGTENGAQVYGSVGGPIESSFARAQN